MLVYVCDCIWGKQMIAFVCCVVVYILIRIAIIEIENCMHEIKLYVKGQVGWFKVCMFVSTWCFVIEIGWVIKQKLDEWLCVPRCLDCVIEFGIESISVELSYLTVSFGMNLLY